MNKLAAGQVTQVIRSSGFDWSDFGIGAGAMLGFVLLAGGIAAGAYDSRKNKVRPPRRPNGSARIRPGRLSSLRRPGRY